MTVAELTTELKQRGLSTKGRKKTLMERLEKAFDEEELNDPSSEEDSESQNDGQGANTVAATTALAADPRRDSESMIVAIELGNRDSLEVRSNEVGKKSDEQMIVAIHLNNPQELRVKETPAEPKQDEPNSLGTWIQEQVPEGTVPRGATASACEVEPSGQSASKVQETERKVELEPARGTESDHVNHTEGGSNLQCNATGTREGGPHDSLPSLSTSHASREETSAPVHSEHTLHAETPIERVSELADLPTTVHLDLPTTVPAPNTRVTTEAQSSSSHENAPPLTSMHLQTQDKTLPSTGSGDSSMSQTVVAEQEKTRTGPPLVADPTSPRVARKDASNTLNRVGREVGQDEVSQGGAEGQIDMDVVVYAEEDEFSMFSSEADELRKFSARGKNNVPIATTTSSRSSSHDQVASSRDRKIGENPQPDASAAELGQTRKRDVTLEKNEQSAVKKRRISAPTTPGADKGEPHERKRRWGSGNKHKGHGVTTDISSDLLQDIIPADTEKEPIKETSALEAVMSYGEDDCADDGVEVKENAGNKEASGEQEKVERHREEVTQKKEQEGASQELETRRRIESRLKVKKEAGNFTPSAPGPHIVSPPKNPPSHILHVENLTRPFTLMQLKELLTEDGPMVKDGFWTNKVKSHCIIVYENQDVAVATRKRLHGMKWPSTNPKLLTADFLSVEKVAMISDGELIIKKEPLDETKDVAMEGDHSAISEGQVTKATSVDTSVVDVEGSSATAATGPGSKPEQPSEQEESEEKASSPATEKAAKTLDTLFRKTVAVPSIYWLPLTEAQANEKAVIEAAKDAERQKRREEREKELFAIREKEEQERKERENKMREEREKEQKLREERRARDEKDRKDHQDKYRDRSRERRRQRSRSNSRPRSRSRSRDRRRR